MIHATNLYCSSSEGALRVDANISIHQEGDPLGVRTEVKNIGSIRSISQAITYEINRQLELVADGHVVTNETRSWDAENRRTIAMRDKEVLQDYRFMPEPNLPPLHLNIKPGSHSTTDIISVAALSEEIPELPEHTRQRLVEHYKLNAETAIILVVGHKLRFINLNIINIPFFSRMNPYFWSILQTLPKA